MSYAPYWVVPASCLLYVIPLLILRTLNLKRQDRYKQLRLPVLALLYSAFCCVSWVQLEEQIDQLMSLHFIQTLLNFISPSGYFSYVTLLFGAVLTNTLFFAAFCIVKLFARIGLRRKSWPADTDEISFAGRIWYSCVSRVYYRLNRRVVLQHCWVGVEYALHWAVWIIGLLFLALTWVLFTPVLGIALVPFDILAAAARSLYLFPAVTLILVNECIWYLGGTKEFEQPGKMVYDSASLRRVNDLDELAEQYKKQFPERFCAELRGRASGSESFYNNANTVNGLEQAIADQLKKRGHTVNRNYLTCVGHLFRHENVLVNATVFSDFGEYLFAYLNTLLARGENALFLCTDEESAKNCADYISDRFRRINNFQKVWLIRDADEVHGSTDADVLVMIPQFVLDDNAFIGQERFFRRLSVVIMLNAAEIISKEGVMMTLLAHRLSRLTENGSRRFLQYVCLSESVHPETSNALRQLLDLRGELYMCDGYRSFDNTRLLLWNYEASRAYSGGKDTLAQDNLFGDSSQTYWGVVVPFACVALKYGLERINVITRAGTPYRQIVSSIKNQISRLMAYFGPDIGFSDFDRVLQFNRTDHIDSSSAFIIAEDELFNLPLAIYNYCRYGGSESGMIHIISKPYMLRDYFAANAERYVNSEARIDMTMPSLSDTKQIVLTKILCEALGHGINQEELLARVQTFAPEVTDLEHALIYCRDMLLPENDGSPLEYSFSKRSENVFDQKVVDFKERILIRVKRDSPLGLLVADARFARMELRGEYEDIGVFANRLRQYFVTTQSFVHNGSIYRVTEIDEKKGIVRVTESADRLDAPVDYIQVRKYALSGEPSSTDIYPVPYKNDGRRMTSGYEARLYHRVYIKVNTLGYFAQNPVNPTLDLANGPDYKHFSEEEQRSSFREYGSASALALRIKGVGEKLSDRVAFLLAVMMNEMLKTIFPYSYPCIAVCPNLTDPQEILKEEVDRRIASAFPQITVSDEFRHDPEDAEVIIVEDCTADLGLLRTLLQNEQYPFGSFFETIRDYLNWCTNYTISSNISNRYLYFGAEEMPLCFDSETLEAICDEFETIRRSGSVRVEHISSKGHCSYCHRELVNVSYTEMQDGAGKFNRKLCDHCASLIVRDEAQLRELYKKTRLYLCNSFGISLPDDITVRFETAEAIRRRVRSGDKRLVVGLADIQKRELWVESDAPPANLLDVLSHELTHFWQRENVNTTDQTYLEGQASFVEVQFMRSEKQYEFADWLDADFRQRRDVYGKGYRLIKSALEEVGEDNSFSYMLEEFGHKSEPYVQTGN